MRTPQAFESLEPRRLLSAFYVTTRGSDAASGTEEAPWRTLQKAANSVLPGDTVTVGAGDYAGFHLTQSGTSKARITFKGEKGATINQRANSQSYYMGLADLDGASYVTIDGFAFTKLVDPTQLKSGIRSVENTSVILRNNTIDSMQWWGIMTGFSSNILIENNITSHMINQHGIYVGNSADNPVIRGNTSFGNRQCGIQINADASQGGDGIVTDALIERNIVYSNGAAGGSGINLDGVQSSTIRNNLLYDNHASGISLYQIDGAESAKNNTIVNNTIVMADSSSSPGRFALNIQNGSTGNEAMNNVLYSYFPRSGGGGSIGISRDSLSGFTSDHNIVDDANGFTIDDSGMSFSQWRAATGQEEASLAAKPGDVFADATAFDFRLKAGSAAIDRGTPSRAPLDDLLGHLRAAGSAPDIGAYEWGLPLHTASSDATLEQAGEHPGRPAKPGKSHLIRIRPGRVMADEIEFQIARNS